jgi:hypothetical protein
MSRTLLVHPLIMFGLCLAIAYMTKDALAASAGDAAYSIGYQMSRALAATVVPMIAVAAVAALLPKLRESRIALVILMWAFWVGLGAMPLAGPILGEMGVEFSILNYNWAPSTRQP